MSDNTDMPLSAFDEDALAELRARVASLEAAALDVCETWAGAFEASGFRKPSPFSRDDKGCSDVCAWCLDARHGRLDKPGVRKHLAAIALRRLLNQHPLRPWGLAPETYLEQAMNTKTTLEDACGITTTDALEAIRGAATNLSASHPTAWSPAWVEKLEAAAELLACLADVSRPLAEQYADNPDPAIRNMAANFDLAHATAVIAVGSLALLNEPSLPSPTEPHTLEER